MRQLYNTLTASLHPYPRTDDEDVFELEPEYIIMQVVNADQPNFDAETEILVPAQIIDTSTKTVTNGWRREPKPEPVYLPVSVTMRSLRLALIAQNLYQVTVAAINGIPDATEKLKAQVWWSTSPIVMRNNPYVIAIGTAVGKTAQEIDQLFLSAKTLDLA